ncbi:unnamed protein product [Nippostrongylus brasiliensis]|uniref:ATP synthase membrane subunit f n=1 Tax=Nippostrongylus brasiliensis TaxID=27835 RepID=A0A0N4YNS6_NIPBR|nr:unnamed protein product [Nippostrongylus brasiliensis]
MKFAPKAALELKFGSRDIYSKESSRERDWPWPPSEGRQTRGSDELGIPASKEVFSKESLELVSGGGSSRASSEVMKVDPTRETIEGKEKEDVQKPSDKSTKGKGKPGKKKGPDSLSEESEHAENSEPVSEDIEVLFPEELKEYVEKVTIGKLSRYGLGRGLGMSKIALYFVALSYMGTLTNITMFNYSMHRQGCRRVGFNIDVA